MTDPTQAKVIDSDFKRINFFTGFFTTADDWNQGQEYHLKRRWLHNRCLHSPGVVRGEGEDLGVCAGGGLEVRVLPGVAVDGAGREILLLQPQTLEVAPPGDASKQVYIAIQYHDELSDWEENVESQEYSGHTRIAERPVLQVRDEQPDNEAWLELARIDLGPGATEIADPSDPDHPHANEIDRRYVHPAGAVGIPAPGQEFSPETLARVIQLLDRTRREFAALDSRFPVPSASDVRHTALTTEITARIGSMGPGRLPNVLSVLAAVEQDVRQEIERIHPALSTQVEFRNYRDAVTALQGSLERRESLEALLNRQEAVVTAAGELSRVVLQCPVATTEPEQSAVTHGQEATLTLDASESLAFGGRQVAAYRWQLVESHIRPPLAHAGPDRTITVAEDQAIVELNASGSYALDQAYIVRYYWNKRK